MPAVINAVPFLDLTHEFKELQAEWFEAIRACGESGAFILGRNVTAFERELAAYVGVKHAVAVANGTDALVLSLRALNIGPGDEVITTPFTFFATAEAVSLVGAIPVFADILPDSFNIDSSAIRACITAKTRAIIPVHLYGHPAQMDEILCIARQYNLVIIEDCAQAFGATVKDRRVGSIGDTGCFSFYPTKVLGCYGDGGMITIGSAELAERLRCLRNHGATQPFIHDAVGYNSRLDEIQAALLRIKLRYIDRAIQARRAVAAAYGLRLQESPVTLPSESSASAGHVFNLYTLCSNRRDHVRQCLSEHNIGSSVCYPVPLHLQEVYRGLSYKPGDLPIAERAAGEVLSLPIYPGMDGAYIERVCEIIREAL